MIQNISQHMQLVFEYAQHSSNNAWLLSFITSCHDKEKTTSVLLQMSFNHNKMSIFVISARAHNQLVLLNCLVVRFVYTQTLMANPKLIRQKVIDRCLRSPKQYAVKDIMEKCNIALEEAGCKPVTSKVTILEDLKGIDAIFPEAHIVQRKVGRYIYYEYEDKSFSIYQIPLSDDEMAQLAQTISILSKFEGMPSFDWVDNFIKHFKSTLNIPSTRDTIVAFDENFDLKGRGWFAKLFSAIASQQALEIKYQPFGQNEKTSLLHPYLLKQYNNRWFLLGCVDGFNTITIFALDRINDIAPANIPYKPNTNIDFQDFFDERVGVSSGRGEAEIIHIKVSNDLYNYIETKPIHGTQKKVREEENGVVIQIEVVINRELVQLLQSYGFGVTVLKPKELQDIIICDAKKKLQNYQSVQTN